MGRSSAEERRCFGGWSAGLPAGETPAGQPAGGRRSSGLEETDQFDGQSEMRLDGTR
jgi:hypothetical protein